MTKWVPGIFCVMCLSAAYRWTSVPPNSGNCQSRRPHSTGLLQASGVHSVHDRTKFWWQPLPTAHWGIVAQRHCKPFHLLVSILPFGGLSCLSVTLVHCAQTDQFLLHTTALCLSQITLNLPSSLNFAPKWSTSLYPLLIWASETFSGKLRPNG